MPFLYHIPNYHTYFITPFLRYSYFISYTLLAYLFYPRFSTFHIPYLIIIPILKHPPSFVPIVFLIPYKHTYFITPSLGYPHFISFTLLSYLFYNTLPFPYFISYIETTTLMLILTSLPYYHTYFRTLSLGYTYFISYTV